MKMQKGFSKHIGWMLCSCYFNQIDLNTQTNAVNWFSADGCHTMKWDDKNWFDFPVNLLYRASVKLWKSGKMRKYMTRKNQLECRKVKFDQSEMVRE